jgi:flagellin-like hook-associated protein FlgL
MAGISLNAGIRASLTQLNRTTASFDQTTNRLATGMKVSSAIDNPTNFFAAVNLNDRAEGLSSRLDSMGQAVQRIQAADNGISTIRSYISAMKGVVNNALGNTDSDARADLGKQFNELIHQIGTAAADSSYQGINLLQTSGEDGESETVQFNETFDESTLEVKGFSMEAANYTSATGAVADIAAGDITGVTQISVAGVGTVNASLVISTQDSTDAIGVQGYSSTVANAATGGAVDWASSNYKTELADVITQLEAYDNELKTQSGALANNLSTITTREEFSTNLINTLTEGADKLTLADLNEEGANLLALQTQNQLATQSLSLASQQSQSVLQLLG